MKNSRLCLTISFSLYIKFKYVNNNLGHIDHWFSLSKKFADGVEGRSRVEFEPQVEKLNQGLRGLIVISIGEQKECDDGLYRNADTLAKARKSEKIHTTFMKKGRWV